MKDFFEQMTDLYDPGPTLLSKYWQFMRLCVCARAPVCAHVHFKVISVMISGNVRAPARACTFQSHLS